MSDISNITDQIGDASEILQPPAGLADWFAAQVTAEPDDDAAPTGLLEYTLDDLLEEGSP